MFSVTAGQHDRFSAWRRAESIAVPRRSVLWRDESETREELVGALTATVQTVTAQDAMGWFAACGCNSIQLFLVNHFSSTPHSLPFQR